MRRVLAALLLAVFAQHAVAEEPDAPPGDEIKFPGDVQTAVTASPPPGAGGRLVLRFQDTTADGVWLAMDQAKLVAAKLAQCETNTAELSRQRVSWKVWLIAGLIVGVTGGMIAEHKLAK